MMKIARKYFLLKSSVIISFLAMVFANFLANFLPINNLTTGEISDFFPNLFTPAGFTFSIWGVIYLLLSIYSIYQCFSFNNKKEILLRKIGIFFIISSIANIFWIISWHYLFIGISLVLIVFILFCLIKIANIINQEKFSNKEKLIILLPFTIYFGWITVATIANITVLLVSLGFRGIILSESVWTIVVLFVGSLIGILRMLKDRNYFYGLVFVWAYFGILLKHISKSGFDWAYLDVIISLIAFILLFIFFICFVIFKKKEFYGNKISNS